MKLKLRALKMGLTFGIVYSSGMTAINMAADTSPTQWLLHFALMALISGLLYGGIMYWMLKRQQKAARSRFPSMEHQTVIDEEIAFRAGNGKPNQVEGWAFLTAEGLYFSCNIKKYDALSCELPFYKIASLSFAEVKGGKNLNCLKVVCTDGTEVSLSFRSMTIEWAGKISTALTQYRETHPQ